MAPYITKRLLFFKKGHEGLRELSDLFADPFSDSKVKISDFEFKLSYELIKGVGKLRLEISPFGWEAKSKLERKFKGNYFPKNVKKDNLIIRNFKFNENSYIFYVDLVSIHDKKTYESVFEYFVKPLVLGK